jgi:aerobic carbon-monoxide dehydrogenase large subunit
MSKVIETEVNQSTDRILRKDGDLILTGQGGYLDDIELPGMLYAAIHRSPHAHARIITVDTSKAESAPGVRGVLTGKEAIKQAGPLHSFFDPALVGGQTADFYCLAVDKVRFVGDPVAAVVADTIYQAEAALKLIIVDYEVLQPVVEIKDALKPNAPKVFDEWKDNVVVTLAYAEGETDRIMQEAEHVIEDELSIQRYQTAPLETRGYIGWWKPTGRITLYASTQNPHLLRSSLASMLDMPETHIRVVQPRVGGGFGAKFFGWHEEPIVCLLSKLAGAPVKWIESRAENLMVGAREFEHRFKVAFDNEGKILAMKDRIFGNVGAMASWGGWSMIYPAGMAFPGPYKVKHYDVESTAVITNKGPWAGARGYGKESACLVFERMVELIAEKLSIDSAEVRRRNFIPEDEFPYWTQAKHLDSGNYIGALEKVLELGGYQDQLAKQVEARKEGRLYGIGIAFELTPEGGDFAGSLPRGYDTSTVRINPQGGVTVMTGVTSPGSGNETSIATLVANEFGISVNDVDVLQGDTDVSPYGYGNFSSRALTVGGAAAVMAARDIKDKLAKAAGVLLKVNPGKLVFKDGVIRVDENEVSSMSFKEVVDQVFRRTFAIPGIEEPQLESTRTAQPGNVRNIPDAQGRTSAYPSYPYSTHMCVVEIDQETGEVDLKEYSAVGDCGKIISKHFVDGQLHGALAMGIGGALFEESPYTADGQPLANHFKSYLLPRTTDLPSFKIDHQETPSPYSILGVKGAGESGVGGAIASVANAVNDALKPLGIKIHKMPLNPPNVLKAIKSGVRA